MKAIRWMGTGLLLAGALFLVLTALPVRQATASVQVEQTVQRYVQGLQDRNVQILSEVTDPHAMFYTVATRGELMRLDREAWLAFFRGNDPAARQKPRLEVVSIDEAGDAATVKTRTTLPGMERTGYLSLLKVGGEWKVVSGIWHQEGAPQSTPW